MRLLDHAQDLLWATTPSASTSTVLAQHWIPPHHHAAHHTAQHHPTNFLLDTSSRSPLAPNAHENLVSESVGQTADGRSCKCTNKKAMQVRRINDANKKSLEMEAEMREMRLLMSKEEMRYRRDDFDEREEEYHKVQGVFEKQFAKFRRARGRFDEAYAYVKKSWLQRCKPMQDSYNVGLDCGKLYSLAMDEYFARGIMPQCKIGVTSGIKLSSAELSKDLVR